MSHRLRLTGAAALVALCCGCYVGSWSWAESTEVYERSTIDVETLALLTHNGQIRVRPAAKGAEMIQVQVRKRIGAATSGEAARLMNQVEVVTPIAGDNDEIQEVRWEWRHGEPANVQVRVSYDVLLPAGVKLMATTHNGELDAAGLDVDCELETHNGEIRLLTATTGAVKAHTHNGRITVGTLAANVDLETHNGEIEASLDNPAVINGRVETHNGRIELVISDEANVCLECRTDNGRIRNRLDGLTDVYQEERDALVGTLGDGTGSLKVETQNGRIELETRQSPLAQIDDIDAIPLESGIRLESDERASDGPASEETASEETESEEATSAEAQSEESESDEPASATSSAGEAEDAPEDAGEVEEDEKEDAGDNGEDADEDKGEDEQP